jgi:hypothetical protein
MDEVFDGLAHEYILNTSLSDPYVDAIMGLSVVGLGVVAEACFWSTHGRGSHLENELARAFTSVETVKALRGQLATLTLSGHALAWGEAVEFIPERSKEKIATPDFVVRRGGTSLFVECTTSERRSTTPNDLEAITAAVARGWTEKKKKFGSEEYRPGLVTIDISGLPVNRGAGVALRTALVDRHVMPIDAVRKMTFGISRARDDFELLVHESQTRGLIAVAASALGSRAAKENDIKGLYVHYGQNVVVDTRSGVISRPIRGTLFWAGAVRDPEFDLALRVAVPAVGNDVPEDMMPPIFVQIV